MVSKTVKRKPTCTHVFTKGPKKDQKCGRVCRGRYCCDHKPKKSVAKSTWYREKKEQKEKDKKQNTLDKINKAKSIEDLPDIKIFKRKFEDLKCKGIDLQEIIIGIKIKLGKDCTKQIKLLKALKWNNNCVCKSENEIEVPDEYKNCRYCDGYHDPQHKECYFCMNDHFKGHRTRIYKEYNHPDTESKMVKKKDALQIEFDKIRKQTKYINDIIVAIRNKQDELQAEE